MSDVVLTDLAIRKLAAEPGRRYEVFDAKLPAFAVRVFPSGVKSFVVFVRAGGRLQRITLGRFPMLGLKEARQRATEALGRAARGEAPQVEGPAAGNPTRFGAVAEEFVRLYCGRHNRESTARETERLLKANFVEPWGERNIGAIGRGDVVELLDRIVERGGPSAANHALAAVRKLFNWCLERGLVEASPCSNIKRPGTIKTRERALSDTELAAVWGASVAIGFPYQQLVRLLILTAQRRGEVTGLLWPEVDLEQRLWTIPGGRTKNKRQHVVPLSPQVVAVIDGLPHLHDTRVFPARGNDDAAFSGFSKMKRQLDAISGVTEWTLHDLRRTAATGMARLGVAPHVVERVLNHVSGTFGGVAGIYNRFEYLSEMRTALELWARHVDGLVPAA